MVLILTTVSFCLLQLSEILKGMKHNFYLLRPTFALKRHQGKSKIWNSKKWCACLLVLFKGKYGELHPIFRTLILVHVKGVGLCCDISLGSWRIHFFMSYYRHKFEHGVSKTIKIVVDTILRQMRWSAFDFLRHVSFYNFESPRNIWKALRTKFSCWRFVNTIKSQEEEPKD